MPQRWRHWKEAGRLVVVNVPTLRGGEQAFSRRDGEFQPAWARRRPANRAPAKPAVDFNNSLQPFGSWRLL
jgi:hypothetical protein